VEEIERSSILRSVRTVNVQYINELFIFDFARSTQPQNRKVSQDADFKMYSIWVYTHTGIKYM
jgi:hypothetical protein